MVPAGRASLGCNFAQWGEHETTLVDTGMMHGEFITVDLDIVEEQKVYIESAGAPVNDALA